MKIRLAADLQKDSIVDGEGLRAVVWTQGCPHRCLGCHNITTHDFNGGFQINVGELLNDIKTLENTDGLTISGGEPFAQAAACTKLAITAHEQNMNVWCYSGYTFEELLHMSESNNKILELLENIDVLIDGKFMLEFRSLSCPFRGSTNQRIIDVIKSLKKRKAVLILKYLDENKIVKTNSSKIYI